MISNHPVYHFMGNQIRNQNVLINQVKEDYKECQERWEQVQKEVADISEAEKILQIIAWVKTGLEELRKLQGSTVEGVSWVKMNKIEKEILRIQDKIRIRIKGVLTDN